MTVVHDLPVRVFDSEEEMGAAAASHVVGLLRRALEERGTARLMLAAAPSQLSTLAAIAAADLDLAGVDCFHMDDYIGLAAEAPQGFGNWLQRNFIDRVSRPPSLHRIDTSLEVSAAAAAYTQVLGDAPFDVTMCGIGVNGHLAFNDPPADFWTDRAVEVVDLELASRQQQVDEGLFSTLDDVPRRARTVTIPRLLHTDHVVCIVPGAHKRAAVAATVESSPDPLVPGSALKLHPDATLYVDTESAPRVA